jgi:hypothetical protein
MEPLIQHGLGVYHYVSHSVVEVHYINQAGMAIQGRPRPLRRMEAGDYEGAEQPFGVRRRLFA